MVNRIFNIMGGIIEGFIGGVILLAGAIFVTMQIIDLIGWLW